MGENTVLQAALEDYDETLVRVDETALSQIVLPQSELSAMRPDILGTAVASTLHSAFDYLFILNSLNFRFWDLKTGEFTRYTCSGREGALGMRAAFFNAWGNEPSQSTFWARLYRDGVKGLFGDIPAMDERVAILEELHDWLQCDYYHALKISLFGKISQSQCITLSDAARFAEAFPLSYEDRYLKKIQLMLNEFSCFVSLTASPVVCKDFTLFADYQLPRVLRALGLISYSTSLASAIDQQIPLEPNGAQERAIRAATVLVGEKLKDRLGCTTAELDNYLWLNRKKVTGHFHLTFTTDY